MTDKFTVRIDGLDELEASLKRLAGKPAQRIVRKAVKTSQGMTLEAARNNARIMVGGRMGELIAEKLTVSVRRKINKGEVTGSVIVGRDERFVDVSKAGVRNWIPNAIEFGHRIANARKGGRQKADPIPFLKTAAESTVKGKVERFIGEASKGIAKEFKKRSKAKK